MKHWLFPLATVAGVILLRRRLAHRFREHMQSLPERMMSHMQHMMERMPEDFP